MNRWPAFVDGPPTADSTSAPDLFPSVEAYVAEMPERVAVMRTALALCDWSLLRNYARRIKDAACEYGFVELVRAAGNFQAAMQWRVLDENLKSTMERLIEKCQECSDAILSPEAAQDTLAIADYCFQYEPGVTQRFYAMNASA